MFKPARMTRVLLGGHRDRMEAVIRVLHTEKILHLDDFEDPTATTTLGTPLDAGEKASADLVRVRGLLKSMDAEGTKPGAPVEVAPTLRKAEQALGPTLKETNELRAAIVAAETEIHLLTPFANVDIDLGALFGLQSVQGYLGTCRDDPSEALAAAGIEFEGRFENRHLALAVPKTNAAAADAILSQHGYTAVNITGKGTPASRLADLRNKKSDAERKLQHMQARMATLRESWASRLAAAERQLAADVAQTQAPLHFAVTETTFHAEGWIPLSKVNRVQNALSAAFDDKVYFETLGDAAAHDDHGHSDAAHEPPVQLTNKGPAKPFEFLLGLLGRPRYNEVDPTKLMFLFFPLFFGFMVGDIVVGLAIALFGLYLKTHYIFGIGGKSVGRALFMGGVVAIVMGGFVFGEGLGIHFVVDDKALEDGEMSWESLIYGKDEVLAGTAGFPHEGFIRKEVSHGGHGIAPGEPHGNGTGNETTNGTLDGGMHTLASETEEHSSPFTFQPHGSTHLTLDGYVNLGYYSKIHDVVPLLMWSVVIGITHIILGLLIGFRNIRKSHGMTLAIQEKASWLLILASVGGLAVHFAVAPSTPLLAASVFVLVAATVLLWQGLTHTVGVGFIALFEIPGIFGNILSYTRLAAVGASKAGMAIAFSAIGFILSGDVVNGVWWFVYCFGMVVITLLAILSGGLQSLRLQFVEFFGKFYTGGGRPYVPFGRRNQ